ncbi:MAG: anthranilate synthase component I family protein [Saprospiraceae bacterium]|nr:anthranilate synthase component I family protein [Saprospiraceae bacterium]
MQVNTIVSKHLADMHTPVSAYLRLRAKYHPCLLLESSDYQTKENSFSLLCAAPLATFQVDECRPTDVEQLQNFIKSIESQADSSIAQRFNSVFGYASSEAVQSFENIQFQNKPGVQIPKLLYHFFRFILVFNHFNEELYIIENIPAGQNSQKDQLEALIFNGEIVHGPSFKAKGEPTSNMSDDDFRQLVRTGKHHCQIGDVFQIVLSRRFQQAYSGDVFNVYRALRSINPSPYSFFYDYGDFQIFGASPEAQIIIRNQEAEIHPIAGTFRRTGNDEEDAIKAQELLKDPKENAEHVMLVDLARNDLSRNAKQVEVSEYKQVQYFSHVIHLVSKVKGLLTDQQKSIQVFADTFPAGTLSGAPKYRAMEIIDELEPTMRGIYGGAIGAFGLNGDVNHAITIRSFFAQNQELHYQAGAGIVIDSNEDNETQEVYNKLAALGKALEQAETI